MARKHYTDVIGTLGSGGLTNVATTHTFTSLTNVNGTAVPTLAAGESFLLSILDASGNVLEVVDVVAYNSGTKAATIVRAREGFTAIAHAGSLNVANGVYPSDFGLTVNIPPSNPNAKDDEDDGTSTATWTTTPSAPTATDVDSTIPKRLYLRSQRTDGVFVGKHQPLGATFPVTFTTRVMSTTMRGNFQRGGGLVIGPATPTTTSPAVYFGLIYNGGPVVQRVYHTNFGGTFSTQGTALDAANTLPVWLRATFASATSVTMDYSPDGENWKTVEAAYTIPFAAAVVGRALSDESNLGGISASFKSFRVT